MRAPLGHAWPQSLVFVAQHQNGGQAHGFCKGVQAPGSGLAACAVDGQSGFFSAVQGMPQVCHAGHGQMLQGSGGGAAGGRAQIGAVVAGHNDARAPKGVKGAAERAHIAGILHLIKGQDYGQGSLLQARKNVFKLAEAGDRKARHHTLVTDGVPARITACLAVSATGRTAQAVENGLFHQRKTHVVFAAEVLHFAGFGAAKPLFAKHAVNALRVAGQQFQHGFEARQKRGVFRLGMHTRLRAE